MTTFLLYPSVLLCAGLPAWAYLASGRPLPAVFLALAGVCWTAGLFFHRDWLALLCLLIVYGITAAGFFLDLRAVLLFTGAFFALLAWDLTDFSTRVRLAAPDDHLAGLERSHLLRLILVAVTGSGLSLLALSLKASFSFEPLALLIIFGVWGIGRVIQGLLQAREEK
jgi:hypothetical protein